MTRPDDPTEALPTRALPVDPSATVDLDRTLPAGGVEPAVPRPATDATVRLAASDATVHLAASEATVHLAGSDTTAHLAASDATVHLAGSDTTAHLAASDATVHLAGSDANRSLAAPDRTVPFGQFGAGSGSIGGASGMTLPAGPVTGAGNPTQVGGVPGGTWPAGPVTGAGVPTQGTGPATGYGGTTGAYHGGAAAARTAGDPARPASGELRFGPGVPATPPPAPPWPAEIPARRPRPRWRRLVSVLSSLLTAALLLVVALYLWQRLSPLEVEGVTVAVPRPAGERCDVTVDVVATVHTNGRGGVIRYQWFRSDAPPGALLSERVGRGERTVTLTLKWTFSGVGATTETATVNLIEPSPLQAGTQVAYRCAGG
ncbi:hypothetical protein [Micromonospora sp. HK10]|uniref:hypothetical protein n=1 Tax=Micromonospora sp. HK10 TaxID=1538294 RepID=UPI0006270399|nr:hypothetical protein [Micromonospora sp. HK10]KKJ93510.1 hypothetical protein LQ51_29990 [Micromonospora sp. HK10]